MQLQGRKALVTGAQQGIGHAIALEFARQGADVAIHYLDDQAAAAALAEQVRGLGRKAVLLQADVSDFAQLAPLAAAAEAGLGGLDLLVNNAGIYPRADLLDLGEADWERTIAVNLKATCFISQAAARRMVAAGRSGAILCMSSTAAQGWEKSAAYSASKGGVIALTRTMAIDLARHHIRVNCIAPGATDTAQPRGGYSEAQLQALVAGLPIPRLGRPDEIARLASFLASDASSYMTGQTVHINGGAFMA